MGIVGDLVVPLLIAGVTGFVVGWFFALTRRKPGGSKTADGLDHRSSSADTAGGAAALEARAIQLESNLAERSRAFAQREAELTTAGRKVVEQLRLRERELAELRGEAEPVSAVPERSRRRAVIDPATGRPIAASGDKTSEDTAPSKRERSESADVDPEPSSEAELSVRLVAPATHRGEPQVIDLRGRPQASETHRADRHRAAGSRDQRDGELTDVVGIGPKTAGLLRQADVVALVDLADIDPMGPLPESIDILRSRMLRDDWVGQAQTLIR